MSSILGADFQAFVVRLPSDGSLSRRLQTAGLPRPAVGLARALAVGPPAQSLEGFALGVRQSPSPWLAFVGPRSANAAPVLDTLQSAISAADARLSLFSWRDAEHATLRLAEEVRRVVSPEDLARARVLGVPRGGLVVAGLLAYALDVPGPRVAPLQAARTADELTILVDDCIISGARLRQILRTVDGTHLVVATLCSHPDVRQAIEAREPHVRACVAARDLEDWGARLLGDEYETWKRSWMERVPEGYDAVLTDLPAFPWSEPDTRSWDQEAGRIRENWKMVPPSLCFRNRVMDPHLDVQVADDRPGIDRLAPWVVPVDTDNALALIDCEAMAGLTLRGTAVELLEAWMDRGREGAAEDVAQRYGVDDERAAADLEAVLARLREAGMLAKGA